jgi:hypothetical protein
MRRSKLDAEALGVSLRFDTLDQKTQAIVSSLLESVNSVTRNNVIIEEIRDQLGALLQIVHRMDRDNKDQYRLTRKIILEQ